MSDRESPPSPLTGEGRGGGAAAHPSEQRHVTGAIERARRLRRELTLAEKKLWTELRKFKLPIRRQTPIGTHIVDFVCHAAKLVIEVDGGVHRLEDVAEKDAVKAQWLEGRGYRILRISNEEVLADPEGAASAIATAVLTPPSQPFPRRGGRA